MKFSDELQAQIVDGLKHERKFRVTNFGVFEVKRRRARIAMNPRTGERVQIPARDRITFRASKKLYEALEI